MVKNQNTSIDQANVNIISNITQSFYYTAVRIPRSPCFFLLVKCTEHSLQPLANKAESNIVQISSDLSMFSLADQRLTSDGVLRV